MRRINHRKLKMLGYPFFLTGAIISKFHAVTGYILIGIMLALWLLAGILETIELFQPQQGD